jgi:transcriptional antiterminator NusG
MDIHENEEHLEDLEPVEESTQASEETQTESLEVPEQDPINTPDSEPEPEEEPQEEILEEEAPADLSDEESAVDGDQEAVEESAEEEILEEEVPADLLVEEHAVDEDREVGEEATQEEILEEDLPEVVEELDPSAELEEAQPKEAIEEEDQPVIAEEIEETAELVEIDEDSMEKDEESEPVDTEVDQDRPLAEPIKDDGRAWYVVHCYSGNEDKVRHNIMQRIESMSMDDLIFDVVVPTEDEVNIKNGERQTVEKKVFPGYILVNMILTEESWYMVRNTPGVTGFVGMGNDPTPLQPEEVARILKRMESESPRINVTFRPGERVRIVDGPFEDFYGKVSEIDMERATVRVMVNFFGRETPVELDFLQVEEA